METKVNPDWLLTQSTSNPLWNISHYKDTMCSEQFTQLHFVLYRIKINSYIFNMALLLVILTKLFFGLNIDSLHYKLLPWEFVSVFLESNLNFHNNSVLHNDISWLCMFCSSKTVWWIFVLRTLQNSSTHVHLIWWMHDRSRGLWSGVYRGAQFTSNHLWKQCGISDPTL